MLGSNENTLNTLTPISFAGCSHACVTPCVHSHFFASVADTLEYTPGYPADAHPTPHDTTPTCRKSDARTSGPPLSPWHESFPISPAHNIDSGTISDP